MVEAIETKCIIDSGTETQKSSAEGMGYLLIWLETMALFDRDDRWAGFQAYGGKEQGATLQIPLAKPPCRNGPAPWPCCPRGPVNGLSNSRGGRAPAGPSRTGPLAGRRRRGRRSGGRGRQPRNGPRAPRSAWPPPPAGGAFGGRVARTDPERGHGSPAVGAAAERAVRDVRRPCCNGELSQRMCMCSGGAGHEEDESPLLPRASELKRAGPRRRASPEGCRLRQAAASLAGGAHGDSPGGLRGPHGRAPDGGPQDSNFLFVGVMTAQKYLQTRALAAYRTWSKTIPGKVEFFSSEGSDTSIPIPIVPLQGVDDSYPPQKKSFMMLKYMHDHYLDKYEWFMRADDDVYIKGDRLENFLRSLNSSEPLFLGQTGLGTTEEMGKLALEPGENFCMGGPGVIMSREVLRRMVPHIGRCLREMYTTHEDVEVGRCVRRFAGVQCVWSYEMQQLFYENYEQNKKGYIRDLHNSKIHRAITLHPNKNPPYQYRLHSYMLSRKIAELRHRTIQLHREIVLMSKYSNTAVHKEDLQLGISPSFMRFQPRQREEILEWEFLTGKYLYSTADGQPPRRGMDSAQREALDDIVMQVMEMINANAKTRGRIIDFKEIQYGYRRVNPMYGAEYILDLLLLYKKHKGKKMTVPVRRHAYLQQTFSKIQFVEHEELDIKELADKINQESGSLSFLSNSLKKLVPFQLPGSKNVHKEPKEKKINILVPLSGRFDMFVRFMGNFEKTCLMQNQNVKLVVLLFNSDSNPDKAKQVELMRDYRAKYPKADMQILPVSGDFSRALALEVGSSQFNNESLLFFCDVDLVFTTEFLQRCRANTVLGQQIYFPIIFSQYDPKIVYSGNVPSGNHFVFTKKTGFWRNYGFGITCIYKGDLVRVGSFDVSIQGWGLEDVDLFNKVVQAGLKTFRSQEVGVVHVHHPVFCDPNLDPKQYKMCLGSKASTYGSTQQLAEMWLEKNDPSYSKSNYNGSVRTA
ncbi:chondroitin sulfate synthase 1 [Echinops telfairi]|uniref:Hexosyltransferase n=1 Tax=Echinops telfairi TaxID=9371 RepID=A0ABM1VIN4_ECHTE|nr:chondroitin sulfate synthase 1 [Echinops telfairi]